MTKVADPEQSREHEAARGKGNRAALLIGLALLAISLGYLVYRYSGVALDFALTHPEIAAGAAAYIGLIVTFGSVRSTRRALMQFSSSRGLFGTLVGVDASSTAKRPDLDQLQNEVERLREHISHKEVSLSEEVEQEVLRLYREALSDKFRDSISGELRLLVGQQFRRESEFAAERFLEDVNVRLSAASSTVTVRGFLNLLLGIAFAGGALYVLSQAISVLTPETLNTLPMSTILYLTGMRISLALVITLIAYFFLSLYRRSLEDVKFYQNEMTNISSRAAALQLAYNEGDKPLKSHVASQLVESDRNKPVPSSSADATEASALEIVKKLVDKLPEFKLGPS